MAIDVAALAGSLPFVEELYDRFRADPQSVDPAWRQLFSDGKGDGKAVGAINGVPAAAVQKIAGVWPLVNAYRVRGHLAADLDPLGLLERPPHPELDPASYGFDDDDADRVVSNGGLHGVEQAPLREILRRLHDAYCGSIGLEFMHISVPERKAWLAERMETRAERAHVDRATHLFMLERLMAAETLERFVHAKYPGTKRFSIEGGESLIPLLDLVLEQVARLGCTEAVLGMAHRGRLNVLVHTIGKRPRDLFTEFEDIEPESTLGAGDVKYHLGYSSDRTDRHGRGLHLSLAFNPSHLEAVDPIVVGRVRAKQRRYKDWDHARVVGVLLHGDAAFAGQGLVAETLNLSALHGYKTGGTFHVVVNNQIGFTASPQEARSTPYSTDVAKMIQCPIFHVNGEDLEAVAQVAQLAAEYRATFQSDVVIDLFCYRKFGHNEMDEPSFTQPIMYRTIQAKVSLVDQYASRLVAQGVVGKDHVDETEGRIRQQLERELEAARASGRRPVIEALGGVWAGYAGGPETGVADVDSGVPRERLHEVAEAATRVPPGFHPHPKVARLLEQRRAMGRGERPLDWGMGELLAFGSLLWDGNLVRLSGQDSARGTFSHRHAIVVDIETGAEHCPLAHLHPTQGECRIYDSPLSELAVLGFEFGYSLDYPDGLVMWEAQFGDFVNGAQVIIDQFISSSEDKWKRLSGLTLLLPHGYEGQGPEHSSARFERFLQSCAEDNMQVAQPTTPAQLYHLLRRQVVRPWRKPLIVMTPKSLLRLPAATSSLDELTAGRFRRVLPDGDPPPAEGVRRVLLCSGKIYYDLAEERRQRGDQTTAIVRLEQFYPWREEELSEALAIYPAAVDHAWVQDEPLNMGGAFFVEPRLRKLFGERGLRVVARAASASPATGSSKAHAIEHRALMDEAFKTV